MRLLALIAVMLSVVGCDRETASDQPQPSQKEVIDYPEKVTALIKLIEQLKPGTNEHEWIELVDRTIDLPEENVILDGGGGLGESWLTIGIGAGDDWALSIESYQNSDEIWEAMVVRTSVSKWLANEPCDTEEIYPHYYKGHIVGNEQEKHALRKQ
ncbi:MAG: hypothetical protein ABJQ29_05635 [Luteolibacter sp.]